MTKTERLEAIERTRLQVTDPDDPTGEKMRQLVESTIEASREVSTSSHVSQ